MRVVRGFSAMAAVLLLMVWGGCGETYRPVANPIVPIQPNPSFTHFAIVVSGNGNNNPGASTTIDVSGDTALSQATVGLMPVHAALVQNASRVYAANSLDDTVSEFSPSGPTPVTTISLPTCSQPPCSMPVFIATTESATVYVATAGDGTENATTHVASSGNGTVAAISTTDNVITNTIAAGISPASMAEIPNGLKLYVANQGNGAANGSVTSINTVDKTANPPIKAQNPPNSNAVWNSPVWVVSRSDGQRVYVLDKGAGTVSAVDTSSDTVVSSASVAVGADFMLYDPTLNRVYVTNPVANTLTSLEASTDALALTTVPVANAVSVAALPDGTRAYVSSAAISGTTITSSVTVLNTADLSVKTIIPVISVGAAQGCPSKTWSELPAAAAADSSRVYMGNCDAGNVAVIQTSNDTLLLTVPAPLSAQPPPPPVNGLCPNQQPPTNGVCLPPPQNPVFVLTGP